MYNKVKTKSDNQTNVILTINFLLRIKNKQSIDSENFHQKTLKRTF